MIGDPLDLAKQINAVQANVINIVYHALPITRDVFDPRSRANCGPGQLSLFRALGSAGVPNLSHAMHDRPMNKKLEQMTNARLAEVVAAEGAWQFASGQMHRSFPGFLVGRHPRDLAGRIQKMAEVGDGWGDINCPVILHEDAAEQRALRPTRPPDRPGASSRRQRDSPASGRLGRRVGNTCAGSPISLKILDDVLLVMSGGPTVCTGFSRRQAAATGRWIIGLPHRNPADSGLLTDGGQRLLRRTVRR
jgi:hypothetical protein